MSADNRFILYLNGHRVGDGPARGDLGHWRYETFDLGPALKAGRNTLSATVWNFGIYAPTAQMTDRTAFLVEGDTAAESSVNTGSEWRVEVEPGQIAYPREPRGFWTYMAAGPGETLVASDYDWNWQTEDTATGRWVGAASAMRENIYPKAGVAGSRGSQTDNPWELVPDRLPSMSYIPEFAGKTVRSDLHDGVEFPQHPVVVSPNSHVHLLLDRTILTTAYPQLTFSGGKGARIVLTYAEALYDEKQLKGDRSEVGKRQAMGVMDQIFPDGGEHRLFETLWWRTWRYLDVEVTTASNALQLETLGAAYTAYPFKQAATFQSSDAELDKIWKIGWHTLELDAHETYMDTPYYEQLQYVGDSRIEAMITYAVTGDPRLPMQAIRSIGDSRRADGLTASRYPSSLPQYIPPFSLLWIGMLHDFAYYREDPQFVREMLPGTRDVLSWFARYQNSDGLLSRLPDWSFVDWTQGGDVLPSYDVNGQSCLVTLQYVGALEEAIDLEHGFGEASIADAYQARLNSTKESVARSCWDPVSHLIADSPAKNIFSQHSNALAVLYDVVPKERQADLMERMLAGGRGKTPVEGQPRLIPASYYFTYYLAGALSHAGMADRYLELLEPWRNMLRLHFSTWPETPGDTRSDSHAWSAHPTYGLLTIVAGIAPASFGFASVRIEPHLGKLELLDAVVPHGKGAIRVHYRVDRGDLSAVVELPNQLAGTFVWQGHSVALHEGVNTITLKK